MLFWPIFCPSLANSCPSFTHLLPVSACLWPLSTSLSPVFSNSSALLSPSFCQSLWASFPPIFSPFPPPFHCFLTSIFSLSSAPYQIETCAAGVVGVGVPLLHSDQKTKREISIFSYKKETVRQVHIHNSISLARVGRDSDAV